MTDQVLFVRKEVVAVAKDCAIQQINRAMSDGRFPRPDLRIKHNRAELHAWRISTLQRHNPALAARCLAITRFLAETPPIAA